METIKLIVEEEYKDIRLDIFLAKLTEDMSRNYIQRLIDENMVIVNGQQNSIKKYKVRPGDVIELTIPDAKTLDILAEDIPIEIVYEDEDLVIINKKKGMVVHPAPGNYSGTLVNAILYHCTNLSTINGIIRPGIVHRIDKDTSGLIMVAKNDRSHESLAAQLKAHTITRVYNAIVYDNIKEDEGTVDAPIGRNINNRLKMAVSTEHGKRAVTHYKVLERFGKFTFIEVQLETGRTHQIRVHMAYKKHPLMGDLVYGPQRVVYGVDTQMLHARVLGFIHPSKGEYMEFSCELPEEFQRVLNILRG